MTRLGPLDVLVERQGTPYQDASAACHGNEIGGGIRIRVLNLESEIAVKEEIGSGKGSCRPAAPPPRTRRIAPEARREIEKARSFRIGLLI